MSREWRIYVSDMLACCDRVIAYTDGVSRESFDERGMVFDATVRNLELLGEAANQLPDEVRAWAPEMSSIDFDLARRFIAAHLPGTSVITIATSPFFIEQARAIDVLHSLL